MPLDSLFAMTPPDLTTHEPAAIDLNARLLHRDGLMLIIDKPWTLAMPSLPTWLSLLGLGVLSSTLGHLIFFRLLASAGATNISLVSYFMPVSAILLGVLFLGDVLETRHIAGMCIIAFGLAVMDGRPYASLRRRLLR